MTDYSAAKREAAVNEIDPKVKVTPKRDRAEIATDYRNHSGQLESRR